MSIEAMKRIKSWLQDTKMIDSHTVSAVVAECDAVILTQQPATGEPVAQWQKRHPVRTGGRWISTDEHDAKWWSERATGWEARALYTHPAPSVPDGYVSVPVQVLRDASEALGNFVSDHGWGDDDMQAMDNLDAYIARHDAKAQKGQP